MDFSEGKLVESKDVRDQGVTRIRSEGREEELLNKVKTLVVAVWDGVSRISRQQLANFYEVSVSTIDSNYQRHRDEFELDGVKLVQGNALKEVRRIMRLTSSSPRETIYTAAGALRMGFVLRDSEVAKEVRTVAIQLIQGVEKSLKGDIVLQRLEL